MKAEYQKRVERARERLTKIEQKIDVLLEERLPNVISVINQRLE